MHKLHWTPWDFTDLPLRKKAVIMAFIDQRIADEKAEKAKIKKPRKGGKH